MWEWRKISCLFSNHKAELIYFLVQLPLHTQQSRTSATASNKKCIQHIYMKSQSNPIGSNPSHAKYMLFVLQSNTEFIHKEKENLLLGPNGNEAPPMVNLLCDSLANCEDLSLNPFWRGVCFHNDHNITIWWEFEQLNCSHSPIQLGHWLICLCRIHGGSCGRSLITATNLLDDLRRRQVWLWFRDFNGAGSAENNGWILIKIVH